MRTVWNGSVSDSFHIVNGIRQGSVISPVLFTVYMDELLQQLERSGVGCCIGAHYYGAAGSAVDLTFYTLCAVTNNLFTPCTTMYYTCDILYNIVPDIFCVWNKIIIIIITVTLHKITVCSRINLSLSFFLVVFASLLSLQYATKRQMDSPANNTGHL